jgi:hypothetical protein
MALLNQFGQQDEEILRGIKGNAPISQGNVVYDNPSVKPIPNAPKQSFFGRIGSGLQDPETLMKLGMLFSSMGSRSQAMVPALQANLESMQSKRQANATAERFRAMGRDDLAQMIEQNPSMALDLTKAYYSSQFKSPSAFSEKVDALVASGVPREDAIKLVIQGSQQQGFSAKFDPETGQFSVSQGGAGGDMTESESNASMFGARMFTANQALVTLESEGTKLGQMIAGKIPVVGNYMLTPEGRQYQNAQKNFVAALLRKESGAVIGQDEIDDAIPIYFPVAGDDPQTIEMKRKNRQIVVNAMMQAGKTEVSGQGMQSSGQPRKIKGADGTIYEYEVVE